MTGSRYDRSVAKSVREVKKPFKFTMDIVEHDQGMYADEYIYYVELRVYENEIAAMNETDRMAVMNYLVMVENVVQSYGIRCELGGAPGNPPQKTTKG